MAYDVSGLSAFTIDNPQQLIYANIYDKGVTAEKMTKMSGIKTSENIHLLAARGVWQAGACDFTASGDATFTKETLTVGTVMVNMSFCERDLEAKWTQMRLKRGGDYDGLTFAQDITDLVIKNVNKDLEVALWRGDTTSGSAYLSRFDGLVKKIGAASGVTTISGTAWSSANSRTVIQALNASIVANADVYSAGTIKYFMSPAMAYDYRQKLITDNLYHLNANNSNTLYAEGTGIEIVEVAGLAGLNYIYAIEPENMFLGIDMENEQEKFRVWYSDVDQKMRLHLEFKAGTAVAFGSRVWQYLGV